MSNRQKLADAKDWAEGQRKGAPNFHAVTLLDALTKTEDERDIYRKALKKIADMPLTQSWQQHFYEAVKIAQDVLQEDRDE